MKRIFYFKSFLNSKEFLERIPLIQVGILFVAYMICYFPILQGMAFRWVNKGEYQYALLIPFIIIYLLWEKRKQIAACAIKSFLPGGILLLLATALAIYGTIGSDISAARLSWWMMAFAIILFCYGLALTKILFFPMLFLGLMIPLPSMIYAPLTMNMKLLSSKLAGWMLHLVGITSVVEGNIIDIGITQLEVVEACSGMRFVLSLACVALLFIYFFQRTWWKRALILLSVFPFSVISNALRVWVIGLSTAKGGPDLMEGFVHVFLSWAIFLISLALLYIFNRILDFCFSPKPQKSTLPSGKSAQSPVIVRKIIRIPYFVLTLSVILIIILVRSNIASFPPLYFPGGLKSFPFLFKDWKGRELFINPEMIPYTGAEEAISREYWQEEGKIISLYIGYRSSPFLEGKEFFHSPNICYPAMGWNILKEEKYQINPSSRPFNVRRMLIEKYRERYLLYFWFQTKDYISHIIFQNRWHLTKHALQGENTPDLLISLVSRIDEKEDTEKTDERLTRFAVDLEFMIRTYLSQLVTSHAT